MTRPVKIYLWAWTATITLIATFIISIQAYNLYCRSLAKDPENIEKITGIDLPEFSDIESSNSLSASRKPPYSYKHIATFANTLPQGTINKLETLCRTDRTRWHKRKDSSLATVYTYRDYDHDYSLSHDMSCYIYKDHSIVIYSIHEPECSCDIENNLYIFSYIMLFTIAGLILWGILLPIYLLIKQWIKLRQK